MELSNGKPVFISSALGGWYPYGLDRLKRSLIYHGTAADFLFFRDEYPPDSPQHNDNPYAFKIYGIREAIRLGYRTLIHIDASFWAIKNPDPIFDIIAEHGIFAFRSGYNCAQTCTDALLNATGYTRDEAEQLPEIATGIVGLHIDNPEESSDPRFLHGRQDQSCFSLAVHKSEVKFDYQDFVSYYNGGNPGYIPEKCYFFIGGL